LLQILKLSIIPNNINAEQIDRAAVKNILVVIRHQMGDMLCASPMIRSLRKAFPAAKITLVTKASTNFSQIYQNDSTLVNEVLKYENGFENFINLIKELRDKRIDIAVVPSTVVCSVTNHLIAYYSQARIRVGVSSFDEVDNEAAFLLNIKKEFAWRRNKVHQIERNLDIIRQLNIEPSEKLIKINSEQNEFTKKFTDINFPDKNRIIIGLHPGAGKPENTWSPEKFAGLASKLCESKNCYIFISEGPDDLNYVNEVTLILKEKYNIQNFTRHKGLLLNNIGLIGLCSVFITNDTGIMHIASGIENVPVIALFGPTNAYEWGPMGKNKISIQSSSKKINDITMEDVYKEAIRFL
jgi:heptosyltransferase-2